MLRRFYIYIMSNCRRTVLYIGVTNSLERRYIEHVLKKDKESFSAKYNVCDLLYYEEYGSSLDAIAREKQLKTWSRKKKIQLIERQNSTMQNLFELTRDSSTPCGRSE